MKQVALVAAMHGNEIYGIELYDEFVKYYPDLAPNVKLVIGNQKAYQENVRYIEADMNRQYGSDVPSHEQSEIARVDSELGAFAADYVIDIHTTKRSSGIFFISDTPDDTKQRVYDMLDIDVCVMKDVVIKQSLIGKYRNAVSLEYSLRSISEQTTRDFVEALARLVKDAPLAVSNQRLYLATRLISSAEWNKYKGLKSYQQTPDGVALMVPADASEMDAEYFGFWCQKL